jgi:polysaccharide chain length determinant protein (PEP-CTERM system associated)
MPEVTPGKPEGFELAKSVWARRKWLAILVFLVPSTVAISVAMSLPDLYQATATVLVDRQQVPESVVRSTVTSTLETRLQTINQEILSRSRLEALISRFSLYPDTRNKMAADDVIGRMRQDIKLELKGIEMKGQGTGTPEATVAFAISYRGSDPNTVAMVTNTLASFYVEENLKVRERQASGTSEFLKVQLDEAKKRLDEQERQVSEFKRKYVGELPQQMDTNMTTLDRLDAQLRTNLDNQMRVNERRHLLASQLAEAESVGVTGPTGTPLEPESSEARLARLKRELPALLSRFSEKYPDVIQTRSEIAALEKQVAQRKADQPGDAKPAPAPASPYVMRLRESRSEAEAEANVLKNEEKRLRGALGLYQSRVDNVPRREQEFKGVFRDYESTRELYQSLLKRYEDAHLAESMEQRQKGEQFRILDPAVPPREALARRFRFIGFSLVVSLALAAGAVLLAEQLDTSFHSMDDLRRFSVVPVLASIPPIVSEADTAREKRRFRLSAAAAALALLLLVVSSYLVATGNEQLVWVLVQGRM